MIKLKKERRAEEVKIDNKKKYVSVLRSFCRHFYSQITYFWTLYQYGAQSLVNI